MKQLTLLLLVGLISGAIAKKYFFTLPNLKIAQETKMIRISSTTKDIVYDPSKALSYQQMIIINLFNDTLVTITDEGRIFSGIAQRWAITEDGRAYTFNIDPTAIFHDGSKILARDVAHSLSRHLATDSTSIVKTAFLDILNGVDVSETTGIASAFEIIDDRTLKVSLIEPYAPFLKILAMTGFSIIPEKTSSKVPIGSGPYKFLSNEGGVVTLTKFKDYPKISPTPDSFSVVLIRELADIKIAFDRNEIDFAIGAPIELLDPKHLPKDINFLPSNTLVMTNLHLNQNIKFFTDKDKRSDFSKLINYIKDNKDLLTDFDKPLQSFLPLGIMPDHYYNRDIKMMTPQEFKSTWHTENRPITCLFPKGLFKASFIEFFATTLKLAGFDPIVIEAKGKELLDPIVSGSYDFVILPFLGIIPDADGYLETITPDGFLKSASIPSQSLINELKQYRFLPNMKDRLEKYSEAFIKFEDEHYIAPIAQQNLPILFRKGVIVPDVKFRFHVNLRKVHWSSVAK
ncbi:ABC transporter substrate-binding protein [Bdellovibrionales bacterium]|nr:ABC transporter substrate-binding protein [Bdellovibrionales bacterium]